MPKLLNIYRRTKFLTILSFDIVSVQTYSRPFRFGENPTEIRNMQSWKCFLPLLKNIQFPDLWSIDRQDRSWKGCWCFGWVSLKHTNIFNANWSDKYVRDFVSQIFWRLLIGQTCLLPFSNANISLDLYLRFLSKNEYLGLNCMWWLSLLSDLG